MDDYTNSIFEQSWWLDAVAPGQWDAVTIEKGGHIFARLPYYQSRAMGMDILRMPPLTQTLGPWFRQSEGKAVKRISERQKLLTELIEKLPKRALTKIHLHKDCTDILPLIWSGFQVSTRYSYVIPDISNIESVKENFQGSVRTDIKKAEKQLTITEEPPIEEFCRLKTMSLENRGVHKAAKLEKTIQAVYAAAKERSCVRVLYAADESGQIHAGAFFVWDDHTAYYIAAGRDAQFKNIGAPSLILWEAIQRFSGSVKSFDFCGSVDPQIEPFARGFGGDQVSYYCVTGYHNFAAKLYGALKLFQGT